MRSHPYVINYFITSSCYGTTLEPNADQGYAKLLSFIQLSSQVIRDSEVQAVIKRVVKIRNKSNHKSSNQRYRRVRQIRSKGCLHSLTIIWLNNSRLQNKGTTYSFPMGRCPPLITSTGNIRVLKSLVFKWTHRPYDSSVL